MDQMPGSFPPPPGDGPPDWGPPPISPYSQMPGGHFPLDVNRLFSMTFSLYRHRRRLFVAIALVVLLPAALVQGAAEVVVGDAFTRFALQMQDVPPGVVPQFPSNLFPLIGLSLLASVIYGIANYVAQAAVTKAAMDTYSGLPSSAGESIRFGLGKIVTLVAVYLVFIAAAFAVVFFGGLLATFSLLAGPVGLFLALVIFVSAIAALLFLSVRWALVVPAVVVEGRGALDALGRSWRLVSGSSWRVLGYVVAFGLLLFAIGLAIAFVVSLVLTIVLTATRSTITIEQMSPLITLAGGLLIAVLVPIPTIGMMLLYFDLRFRKGEQVPQPGSAPAAITPPEPTGPPTF